MRVRQITPNLIQLTRLRFVNAYLVREAGGFTLVDTTVARSGDALIEAAEKAGAPIRRIAITHGHGDHVGETVELAKKFKPEIVAMVELHGWLGEKGAPTDGMGPNKGGTVEAGGARFTLVNAFHSSAAPDGTYVGEAAGIVVELENGTTLYFAGDTCVFGDMQLIGRIYDPDVAVLPIGGHFTMDPREAGVALELLGTKRCIPYHYGTFPLLAGTPAALREQAPGVEVIELQPGETTTV
jgi:L-ascorbate metabolism protein UlaG (beta-lactamase superfamily)